MAPFLETIWLQGRASIEFLVLDHKSRVPTYRLCPPGEPNEAMGQRVPNRRMVPAIEQRTTRL